MPMAQAFGTLRVRAPQLFIKAQHMTTTWQPLTPQPYALGESPFWHPVEQMLYWVDIPGQTIHRCNVFMGSIESWAMPSEPGCIAPAQSGGLVIGLRDGITALPPGAGSWNCWRLHSTTPPPPVSMMARLTLSGGFGLARCLSRELRPTRSFFR